MFVFGNPEDTARTLCESAEKKTPGLVNKPIDEMSVEEMKRSLAILRMAAHRAEIHGSGKESLEVIIGWHDELLRALAEVDEKTRERLASGKYAGFSKRTAENKQRYIDMANEAA